MANTIRRRVDGEIARRVGKWFTVREIQDKLRINPSTLKPLIMKYAREKLLKRRSVPGTARSVQFSPAASTINNWNQLLQNRMPYREAGTTTTRSTAAKKRTATKSKPKAKTKSKARSTTKRTTARKSTTKKTSRRKK